MGTNLENILIILIKTFIEDCWIRKCLGKYKNMLKKLVVNCYHGTKILIKYIYD